MKAIRPLVLPLFLLGLLASCATGHGYHQLPAGATAIDLSSDAVDTFVIEIDPAFGEPFGVRYEFDQGEHPRGVKTTYPPGHPASQTFLSPAEITRLRTALLAFDWNHAEDPQAPDVLRPVPDDTSVLFRARIGAVYHEVRVGLSNSTNLERLLREIGLLK